MRDWQQGRGLAALCWLAVVALLPSAVHADAQLALIVAPAGEPAERIAARIRELLEAASVTTSTRAADPADASVLAPGDGEPTWRSRSAPAPT